MSGEPVGVVGLGDMGGAIATALLAASLEVLVFDRAEDRVARQVAAGARATASVTALAETCPIVSIVVVDDAQVRDVVDAVLSASHRPATILVHSTVLPATVVELASVAAQAGVGLLDAPVSGGSEKAAQGSLTVLVGGSAEAVRAGAPVLHAIGRRVLHVGPVGAGSAAKIINNMITHATYGVLLEAMQLADVHGITEDAVTEIVCASQGDSRMMRTWGRWDRLRAERAHVQGAASAYWQIAKDLRLAALDAGAHGITLPLTAVTAGLFPGMLQARDRVLSESGSAPALPRCRGCCQELAAPFRAAGVHPECALT